VESGVKSNKRVQGTPSTTPSREGSVEKSGVKLGRSRSHGGRKRSVSTTAGMDIIGLNSNRFKSMLKLNLGNMKNFKFFKIFSCIL
jgi:hypothetical protein